MSSVISHEKCTRCGGVLSIEFDCRSFEEWKGCSRCGRRDGWHYIRDEEGKTILDSEGQPQKEFDDLPGYGVAYLQFEKVGVCYPFTKPHDKFPKRLMRWKAVMQKKRRMQNELSYLARLWVWC